MSRICCGPNGSYRLNGITAEPYPAFRQGYTVPEFGGRLNGITDWVGGVWDILTGKPQSWYTHLDQDQQALAIRAAEINAIGEGPWNTVRDEYMAQAQGPGVDFLSFSDINAGIDQNLKTLLVTKSHVPSDQEIAAAENYNAQYGRYVDYVKSVLPELSAQIQADATAVKDALGPGTMKSPSSVGQQAFIDEVERRAKLLGAAVGGGMLLYLAIPAILAVVLSGGRR